MKRIKTMRLPKSLIVAVAVAGLASTALADGDGWTAVVTAHARAASASDTLARTRGVDITPPTDPGSPTAGNLGDDGNWYINTMRPTFSWAASEDPDGPDGSPGSGLSHYQFQFGTEESKPGPDEDGWPYPGCLVGMWETPATPGAATQQLTFPFELWLAAGVCYAARVRAFDVLGNASSWVDPSIVYDPDPPTAPGTPAATVDPTNDATPVWTWAGSDDAISGVDLYHIQIRRDGSASWDVLDTELDIPDARAPGDETWEQALQLESGGYEIRVRAMDVAGNYSAWSELGAVTIDRTPPEVAFINPTDGGTFDVTTSSTIIAEITGAFDPENVWLWIDTGVSGGVKPTAVLGGTVYHVPDAPFGPGEHTVTIRVYDEAGNKLAEDPSVTFIVEGYRRGFGIGRLRFEDPEGPE